MANKLFSRFILVAVAAVAAALAGPVAQADAAPQGQGITAVEVAEAQPKVMQPPPGGWDVPSDRSYHLLSSCEPYAAAISQGAAAWAGLNETANSGTPVECRDSYITDCGGGGRIVGCNWGRGQRIALFPGGVSDVTLLAAHEFGHDWYGHSSYRCAGWSSPEHVMAPSLCYGTKSIRID